MVFFIQSTCENTKKMFNIESQLTLTGETMLAGRPGVHHVSLLTLAS